MALADREVVLRALHDSQWVIAHAAKMLRHSRQAIYDAMERFDIPREPQPEEVYRALRRQTGGMRRRGGAAA